MTRLPLLFVTAIATCALAAPAFAAGPAGSLTQLAGTAGCITKDGKSNSVAAQCADGRGLAGAEALALSPDGKFAYAYSYDTGAIAILSRDPATGALSQADDPGACVAKSTLLGDCTGGRMPSAQSDSAHAIAITPDGSFLFVAGSQQAVVSVFSRDAATGSLTEVSGQNGCVSANGTDANGGPTCSTFGPLALPQSLALSPDGKFLYVGGNAAVGLTIFSVGATGTLTPLAPSDGCISATATAGCTVARYANNLYDLALSPDGHTLYGANIDDGVVVAFARNPGTGNVTQIAGLGGCVIDSASLPGPGDPCTVGHGLSVLVSVEVSPDGKLVTVGNFRTGGPTPTGNDGIAVLHRNPATGELSQSDGAAGCVNQGPTDGCGTSRTTGDVYRTLFSSDGRTLFAAAYADGTPQNSGISVFDVAADGTLTQRAGALGCFSDTGFDSTGTAGGCATARGVNGPVGLALSSDGASLYESAYVDGGVAAFRAEVVPACANATASTALGTAVAVPVSCTDANGDTVTLATVDGPAHGSVTFSGLSATYTPAAGFLGDDSFRVKGNDGANDSAPATVTVHVAAVAAKKLSFSAKPKRDRKLPFKFTFSGKLTLPAGVSAAQGCTGKVALRVKRGKKTVLKKSAKVSSACKWKVVATFKNRKKLGKKRSGTLTATARFGGNAAVLAKSAKAVKVRFG
jgi:6-phosphogluconolactonase (cycloisomerase 2 family)